MGGKAKEGREKNIKKEIGKEGGGCIDRPRACVCVCACRGTRREFH